MKYGKKYSKDSYIEKLLQDIANEKVNSEQTTLIKKRKWYQYIFCC